jgi:hypothetical protein
MSSARRSPGNPTPSCGADRRPAVWSPLEYCCHLRDVLITQRERVVRVLVEERPTVLPMHREERAVLTRYAEEAPSRVLAQLGAATEMASWTFVDVRRILRPPAD